MSFKEAHAAAVGLAAPPPKPDAPENGGPGFSRGLRIALRHAGASVMYQDRELRILWAENLPEHFYPGDPAGLRDEDILPAEDAGRISELKRGMLESREPCETAVSILRDGGWASFTLCIDPDCGPDGSIQGLVTTVLDTTEQSRAEKSRRALLRDVSHRSRNLLAIIQSLAWQTGRHSGSVEGFLARLRGRLQSLASSQDLVTSSNWRGARLSELVAGQLGLDAVGESEPVIFSGDDPFLSPNAAMHVGLALHELAVNSVNFGALARGKGQVTIEARSAPDGAAESGLTITWREPVEPGSRLADKRFGSLALERVVPAALNTQAELHMDGSTLRYSLRLRREDLDFG